jgi:hypothetical protein
LIQEHDNKVERACHLCSNRGVNWRAHIGTHILRFIRRVNETLRAPVCALLGTGFIFSSRADWVKPALWFLRCFR